jgi:hypothetical protein
MTYPNLVNSYLDFCCIKEESCKKNIIDLSNKLWFYPTTLLPLGVYIKKYRASMKYLPPAEERIEKYIGLMINPAQMYHSSYVPLVILPQDQTEVNRLLSNLSPPKNAWGIVGGKSTYETLIDELVDNIYEHSEFSNAAVMAQRYDRKEIIELCILDDGISIPGSYKKHLGLEFDGVKAIEEAINGRSTKSEERGHGLYDSIKLVSEGMSGEIMIVSGDGIFYRDKSNNKLYSLQDENYRLDGTLISIRLPFQRKDVLWYEYIQ